MTLAEQKTITEEYLKGLYSYLDMALDAETDKKRQSIIQIKMDVIEETLRLISTYNPEK
jgi:hypothetical protein